MTTGTERTRAVLAVPAAIKALVVHAQGAPPMTRVPTSLITDLARILRHYPTETEMKIAAERDPEMWA